MKALSYAIATAALAGLLTGGVMKLGPDALADRPTGPQILISGASKRVIDANGWYADARLISAGGEVPEYVLGTDWTQPVSYDVAYEEAVYDPLPAEEPYVEQAAYEPPAVKVSTPPEVTQASYPSVDGDILAGLHEAAAPDQVVEVEPAGDTLTS
jgi:hypothetical protein